MMPMINFTNAFTVLLALIIFLLVLILGKETKKSLFPAIMLFVFLAILCAHAYLYFGTKKEEVEILVTLARCLTVDFVFVFLSFISYLWIDDIETKLNHKKSIDNSLDWFWSKV